MADSGISPGCIRMTAAASWSMIDQVTDTKAGDDVAQDEAPARDGRRRPWRRSSADRYVGGVAAGLARWLDVDPLLVRIGLVVLSVFWPLAVVVYTALWLLVPSDREPRSLLRRIGEADAFREVLGAVALAIAVALLLPDLRPGGSTSLQFGVLLVGVGLALLARPAPPPGPASPPGPAPRVQGGRSFSLPQLPAVRLPRRRPARPRPRPFLTPLALSLLVLLVGVVAGLEAVDDRVTSPGTVASLFMVLVGATLVLSARWGRARALLLLVPPLLVGWTAFSLTDMPRHSGVGERSYTLRSPADVQQYTLGAGSLSIDAGRLSLRPGERLTLDASVNAGRLAIDVPFDAALRLEGRMGLGQVEVWDERIGAWYRQYDTGPTANRRLDRNLRALAPLCWPVAEADGPSGRFEGTQASTLVPPFGVTSTTQLSPAPVPTATTVTTYQTPSGEPCLPGVAQENPPLITIRFAVGAGSLEVHRVEARD